jgi:hypothetical protein
MTGPRPKGQKTDLALAIAHGIAVAKWARDHDVPKRTAYTWAREPKMRAAVESIRRQAIDRAVGRMSRRVTWAADAVAKLAKDAVSESVRLAALRAIIADMMEVTKFSGLERRMVDIEERLSERTENPDCTS